MFGATGDQKSDVEKKPKKNCHKLRITNDNQFLTVLKTVYGARRISWTNSIGNRGSAVFGATGDQKSDVEKTQKKISPKLRITNDIQFLTVLKSVHGARRTNVSKPIGKQGGSPLALLRDPEYSWSNFDRRLTYSKCCQGLPSHRILCVCERILFWTLEPRIGIGVR